jgi:DNA helicase-2/ATP-dependent DNA helicase PcrA
VVLNVDELLADLTAEQREAATHVEGPLLIIAGAGSGKTRVITRRVAYLMAQGVPAWAVLGITFTNKAAGEMKHRIGALMDRPLRDFGRLDQPWPTICTFHSLCLRVLRHYAVTVGLPANFAIYDSGDQEKVIKEAIKTLELSTTNFPPGNIHGAISKAKNQLLTPELYAQQAGDFYSRTVSRIYTKYQALLTQNNAVDFDDLLMLTANALRDHPQVLAELQQRYQYILIDEYQDTNHAQYIVAHALAQRHKNMCVVGDPDQSIYAWRGADIRNILDFETDYPDAKVVKLEQNYRSTKTILAIASDLISHNKQRKEKGLWTTKEMGEPAHVYICQDEDDEARVVAEEIKTLHEKNGVGYNQMAIFYRMNSLSRAMEDALRFGGIPYVMARGTAFYERKEIKDVLAYLRVIANPADEVNLERIVNTPTRGIGDASVKQMKVFAVGNGIGLFNAMERVGEVQGVSTRAAGAVQKFVGMMKLWQGMAKTIAPGPVDMEDGGMFSPVKQVVSVRTLMEDVIKRSGIEAMLLKKGEGDASGDEDPLGNVNGLITEAAKFDLESPEGTLDDYLAAVTLVSDQDAMKEGSGAVTMMTLHAAKGLEFPVVAMIGLEEGILPHSRTRGNPMELEEERRLCFVGITRAQDRLILTKANYRMMRGLRERTVTSPFFNEMPQEMLRITDRAGIAYGGEESREATRSRMETESERLAGSFRKGQMVRHPAFGVGRIAEISNMGQQTKAVIDFTMAGRKTLILQYARLEAVGN